MHATELAPYIDRIGLLRVDFARQGVRAQSRDKGESGQLLVPVVVIDAKRAWGKLRLRVRPATRRKDLGRVWVDAARVTLQEVKADASQPAR